MILHLIFYFVVFCVIFAYNILDNGYIPFIVDIIFVSISIISVVVCMILRAGIKCSFETEMLTVRRNEKNDISIRLRNKSFIPAPYCKFRIKFIMGNGKKKTRRCNVFFLCQNEICFSVRPHPGWDLRPLMWNLRCGTEKLDSLSGLLGP